MRQKEKIFFSNLDALRFFAFLLVFFQHALQNSFVKFYDIDPNLDRLIDTVFSGGGTGVQIFFVLSGFLITYLLIKEIQLTGKVNIGQFYLRRTLRIWPLYFLIVLFGFIIYPYLKLLVGLTSDLCSNPLYYYSFLANFDLIRIAQDCPGQDSAIQGILWSVSIEEQFYVIWPLLFLIFTRNYQLLIFLLVTLLCFLFRWKFSDNESVLYLHTFSVMGDLAIGGLGAFLMIKNGNFKSYIVNLSKMSLIATYLFIVCLYFCRDMISDLYGFNIYGRFIFDIFWLFIILTQCFSKNLPFEVNKLKTVSQLGKISYGLYLIHPIGILIVDIGVRLFNIQSVSLWLNLMFACLAFFVTVILSKISFKYLETPFLKLKEKFSVIKSS